MAWADPTQPNLPDFRLFVAQSMGMGAGLVPDDSPFPAWALAKALALVIDVSAGNADYTQAAYNCAGHVLLTLLPPQAGTPFMANVRRKFHLLEGEFGLVESASDEGTSVNMAIPQALKELTLGDLEFTQTPWGRRYLAYNQDFGQIVGLT